MKLVQTVLAVLSAFVGIRRREDHEATEIKPVQVILVAVALALLLLGTVLFIVIKFVVPN